MLKIPSRRRGQTWAKNVERRSPGWRPGRRLSIYVAYWVWVGSGYGLCTAARIWLDGVDYQAGSVAEGRGVSAVQVQYTKVKLGVGRSGGGSTRPWGGLAFRFYTTAM